MYEENGEGEASKRRGKMGGEKKGIFRKYPNKKKEKLNRMREGNQDVWNLEPCWKRPGELGRKKG